MSAVALVGPAAAQTPTAAPQGAPVPAPAAAPPAPRFGYDAVIRRAREVAEMAFDATAPSLPDPLPKLDFDAWRDIRFKADKALLGNGGGPFRMQLFHPGFLFQRPVTVNILRDGIATPVPYSNQMFDYGRTKIEKPLPVNLGFAGFRLHYPLNEAKVLDELVSFVGASYFRVLGRDQHYGLSARGLAVDTGSGNEEFPFFREFWVETPAAGASRIVVHALLDSPSLAGAYQFVIYPGRETVMDITATLIPRRAIEKLGIAPLTSMFFTGENHRRYYDDYRSEVHDSDGLMIHSASGEWLFRPLNNPQDLTISAFIERNVRGFGLLQRDRTFEHYQDLDANYERRPSYFVEPVGDWGEGRVELVEIPTPNETNDNIVAYFVPSAPVEPGKTMTYRYRLTSLSDEARLHPGGRSLNTFRTAPRAAGSSEPDVPNTTRFLVDFAGGDLEYYLSDPASIEFVPTTSAGRIVRTFVVPNRMTSGFRAAMDVEVPTGQTATLRAFLRAGSRTLTETWTYPWRPE